MTRLPMLHQTDLFRAPADPDDHWDLACIYALAARGDIDLGGILLDFTPDHYPGREPDIIAVAQLNYLTGIAAPFAVGSSRLFEPGPEHIASLPERELAGARFVLRFLDQIETPGIINTVGSCRDVALALSLDPDLFARKCAAIYLNAGCGCPDPALVVRPEYNVVLNPAAYAAIFNAPCPVYWLPAFDGRPNSYKTVTHEFATWFVFNQEAVLASLSPELRGYFISGLEGRFDTRYLRYLLQPETESFSIYTVRSDRHMWCTAGFLHAAGYAVTVDGDTVELGAEGDAGICEFLPIDVSCDDLGQTTWHPAAGPTNRYIFRVKQLEAYSPAIIKAMTQLLATL